MIWVYLTNERKARTRPNQVLTSIDLPCRTITASGVSDASISQYWLLCDKGWAIPLPPRELLVDEPPDSPIMNQRVS